MKINLEKLIYKNILSVGAAPVEMVLNKHHTTLITGRNGASKSTMIEALIFALFGRPYRDINKNQLINSINKKGLVVELWFNINNKTKYYIKRGIKPNVFILEIDGVAVDEDSSVRDFQRELEQDILKMNYKTAKQIVALGTAGFTPFMQLKTYERRGIIDDLLDIEVFSKMSENNKKQADVLNVEFDSVNSTIAFNEREIGIRKQFLESHKEDKEKQIAAVNSKISELQKSIVAANDAKTKIHDCIVRLNASYKPFDKERMSELKTTKSAYEIESANIQKGLRFFAEHSTKCPTCKQHLDDEFVGAKVDQYTREYNASQSNLETTNAAIAELDALKLRNSKIDAKRIEFENQMRDWNIKIDAWKKTVDKYSAEIKTLREEHATIDKTELNTLVTNTKKLVGTKKQLSDKKYCYSVVANLLKDSGVKARIINQYIPVINQLINNFLGIMEANYKFELDSEFNEKILSRGREEFSYMSFSQGEKMRIDLAILFTWRELIKLKNAASFNILILDEVMDSAADQDGVDCIMKIISDLKDNVYIISHNDKIDPTSFSHHINMVKVGNFSCIDKNV